MNCIQNIQDKIESIPHHLDFIGQKRAEKLFQFIIVICGIVGFIWGYYFQQISQTLIILGIGFIASVLLVVIPWPFYRRNPLNWQPVLVNDSSTEKVEDKKEKSSTKSKKNKK